MTKECDDGSSAAEGLENAAPEGLENAAPEGLENAAPEGLENAQLQHAVSQRLGHTGRQGLRRVNVVVDNHRVILSGTVTSYYLKQMAQETARQACPNLKVYNDLDVV